MLPLLLLSTVLVAGPRVDDPRIEALWAKGTEYAAFGDTLRARRETWYRNTAAAAQIPLELIDRARAVPGTWRFLVITDARCHDSANTVPFLAALARVSSIELRIVSPGQARWLQEAHRSPDGRLSTPTVILLNDRFEDVGAWIERPAALQTWVLENKPKLPNDKVLEYEFAWYEKDQGRTSLSEIVELLEKAAARRAFQAPT